MTNPLIPFRYRNSDIATGWKGYGKPGVTDPATRDEYTRLDLLETKAATPPALRHGPMTWPLPLRPPSFRIGGNAVTDPLAAIDQSSHLLRRLGHADAADALGEAWAKAARLVEANVQFDAAEFAVLSHRGGPFVDKSAVLGEAKLHLRSCIEAIAGPLDRTVKRGRK